MSQLLFVSRKSDWDFRKHFIDQAREQRKAFDDFIRGIFHLK